MNARPAPTVLRRRARPRGLVGLAVLLAVAVVGWAPPVAAGAAVADGAAGVRGDELVPLAAAGSPDPDPGATGPVAVDELSYDLGALAFRPAAYPAAVEVRAKVYAPATIEGRAPVVVVQHGRHVSCGTDESLSLEWPCPAARPEIPSYRGYDALGRLLASHGVIVVSVGANGINASDAFVADGGADGRGQLVLEHLRLWRQWDAGPGGPFGSRFVGRVDLDRVGLMGHSRGGEGVVAAAQRNRALGAPYGIRTVVALAPVDFARRVLRDMPLQIVLPYCDGDVSDLQGAAYYDDSRYGLQPDPSPKQTTLLYGANHNFFNTVWTTGPGSFDDTGWGGPPLPGPDGCQPGHEGRLTGPQQAAAGATVMGGFLRRHLLDEAALQPFVTGVAPFPASSGPARWAVAHHGGARTDVSRWIDGADARTDRLGAPSSVRALSAGLTCTLQDHRWTGDPPTPAIPICPGAGALEAPHHTAALDLGWIRPGGVVRAGLPVDGLDVTAHDGLRFRLGVPPDSRNERRGRQDLVVRLTDVDGHRASVAVGSRTNAVARLPVSGVQHTVLNGVRLPLSAFTGVDLSRVAAVELVFDRTASGRVLVNDLAFTTEDTGDRVGPTDGPATTAPVIRDCRRGDARRWACAVAAVVLGREAVPGGDMETLTSVFASPGARRAQLARLLTQPNAAEPVVGRIGQVMLEDGWHQWINDLALYSSRGRWEDALTFVATGVPGSTPETATPGGVVDALYLALVGRAPDVPGRAFWLPRVAAGQVAPLARSLMASSERAARVVDERYRQILGRAPDAGGREFWVPVLRGTGGEQRMLVSLLSSSEMVSVAVR